MKKRIFAVLMAVVLTLSMTVTVLADPTTPIFRPSSTPICPPPAVCPPPDAV